MKPVSIEQQAQHIVDSLVDRMYILLEKEDIKSAQAIYREIKDWIATYGNVENDYAEVLSVEIM
jgi:hypothetical protein